jgi:hypothetical protein
MIPCFLFVAIVATGMVAWQFVGKSNRIKDDGEAQAREAINELWSADGVQRGFARGKLILLGQPAVEPLVSLMENLVEDRTPRHVPRNDGSGAREDIRAELVESAAWVLGQLRAAPAARVLVKAMILPESSGPSEFVINSTEMEALVRIGPPAVSVLIEAIKNADALTPNEPVPNLAGEMRQLGIIVLGRIGDPSALPFLEYLRDTRPEEYLAAPHPPGNR